MDTVQEDDFEGFQEHITNNYIGYPNGFCKLGFGGYFCPFKLA